MISIFFAVLAGLFLTMQSSLNGLLTPYLGAMGASFAGFTVQLVLLLLYQLIRERKPVGLRKVPFVYYTGGFIAAINVAVLANCVSVLGSAVVSCCSVAGQIIMSAIADHFGLFGAEKNRFRVRRIPGFLLILGGVLAMNLIGGSGSESVSPLHLFLAVLMGVCAIIIRSMNHKAADICGSTIGGGIVNSAGGMVFAFVLLLFMTRFRPDFPAYITVPPYLYLAGACGTACLLCNILAYKKINVFYATIFMLIGQVTTGIVMDVLVFKALSTGKIIGIVIVTAGIFLDKFLSGKKD